MIAEATFDTQLNRVFGALADPIRRSILDQLARGSATVGELVAQHQVTGGAITKHLKVLESAGLLVREKDAQWRRCHARVEGLTEARRWIEDRQAFWNEQFDQLEGYLQSSD